MSIDYKAEMEKLIREGEEVKRVNLIHPVGMIDYISGNEYEVWMNKIKLFCNRYLKEYPLYNEIIEVYNSRNNSWGLTAYEKMIGFLSTVRDDNFEQQQINTVESPEETSEKIVFISHASADIDYIKPLVTLLENIGFAGKGNLFCSSLSGYWIPNGEKIYDYLKAQLNKDVYVILVLSDNYYSSTACMNELGATWVKSIEYNAVLVPGFSYSHIEGAIDPSQIMFKLNDKERLNEYKDELISKFEFNSLDSNIWERKREEFLDEVNRTYESSRYKNYKQKVDVEEVLPIHSDMVSCILRFINKGESPQICKSVDIEMKDDGNNSIRFKIPYSKLKDYVIYSNENRRIIINITNNDIEGFSNFHLLRWKTVHVESFWSNASM